MPVSSHKEISVDDRHDQEIWDQRIQGVDAYIMSSLNVREDLFLVFHFTLYGLVQVPGFIWYLAKIRLYGGFLLFISSLKVWLKCWISFGTYQKPSYLVCFYRSVSSSVVWLKCLVSFCTQQSQFYFGL